MIEFAAGDLYEFNGIPGQADEGLHGDLSRLGLILKVDEVTLDGRLWVTRGYRIMGRPDAQITFAQPTAVPLTDAIAMIKREIWIKTGAV